MAGIACVLALASCKSMHDNDPPEDGVVREGIVEIYRGQGPDRELIGAYTTQADEPGKRLWVLVDGVTPHLSPGVGETLQYEHVSMAVTTAGELCLSYGTLLGGWKVWESDTAYWASSACEGMAVQELPEALPVPLEKLDPPQRR